MLDGFPETVALAALLTCGLAGSLGPQSNDSGVSYDYGSLLCYSCNSLLGDDFCKSWDRKYPPTIRCPSDVGVLPTCVFKKDEEFTSRTMGGEGRHIANKLEVTVVDFDKTIHVLKDDDEQLISECGRRCSQANSSVRRTKWRNLLSPHHTIDRPRNDISSDSEDRSVDRCFKLDFLIKDGIRGFTIRGCATDTRGCLIGNIIDTEEYECNVCDEPLCNSTGTAKLFLYGFVIIQTVLIDNIIML